MGEQLNLGTTEERIDVCPCQNKGFLFYLSIPSVPYDYHPWLFLRSLSLSNCQNYSLASYSGQLMPKGAGGHLAVNLHPTL